jgi:hypothetical protein
MKHVPISHADCEARIVVLAGVDVGAPIETIWDYAAERGIAPRSVERAVRALALEERNGSYALPANVTLFNKVRLLRERSRLIPHFMRGLGSMSNVVLHPSYYPRLNAAIDNVVSGIRRADLEKWLAPLGETEWNNVIVEAVKTELVQPSTGVATVLKLLRRAA